MILGSNKHIQELNKYTDKDKERPPKWSFEVEKFIWNSESFKKTCGDGKHFYGYSAGNEKGTIKTNLKG